jgi:hypothetical protein
MKTCFDLASVALFDLLVIASNRGATCHVASHQENDVEAEGDVHDSVLHDVGVDQQHQQDQHAANGSGSGEGKFNEGHDSLLGSREHVNDAVCSHAEADEAQDEDEEGHGGSVRVVVEQNVDDHVQQHCNGDEDNGNGDEVGHGSGHLLLWSAGLDERFERHLAFGEVAHGEHEFRRNAVIRHLSDATRRDAESICERFGSAALRFEPSFEIHGASLEQPKRLRQGFSKPYMFKLD